MGRKEGRKVLDSTRQALVHVHIHVHTIKEKRKETKKEGNRDGVRYREIGTNRNGLRFI